MEPISILLLLIVTLFGTGAGRQVYKRNRRRRKEELREALLKKLRPFVTLQGKTTLGTR